MWMAPGIYQSLFKAMEMKKNGTSLNGPMLSTHSSSDDGSDVSFCVLFSVFAARQFQHDGKALVQFWGFRVDGSGTIGMR